MREAFQNYFVPFLFTKKAEICSYIFAVIFFILGIVACINLELGLNQNVALISGSDTFKFFDSLAEYNTAGPPAYLVFKDLDYTNEKNLDTLSDISDGLSQLNETVVKPIYSWVKTFQQFRSPGEWADICGSEVAMNLGFDDAMAMFVKIGIETDCC